MSRREVAHQKIGPLFQSKYSKMLWCHKAFLLQQNYGKTVYFKSGYIDTTSNDCSLKNVAKNVLPALGTDARLWQTKHYGQPKGGQRAY